MFLFLLFHFGIAFHSRYWKYSWILYVHHLPMHNCKYFSQDWFWTSYGTRDRLGTTLCSTTYKICCAFNVMMWEYYLTMQWIRLSSNPQIHIHKSILPSKERIKKLIPTRPRTQNNWLPPHHTQGFAVASLYDLGTEQLAPPLGLKEVS